MPAFEGSTWRHNSVHAPALGPLLASQLPRLRGSNHARARVLREPNEEEHRAEVLLVDSVLRSCLHLGLGAEGDAQACSIEHRDIVRAVAHCYRLLHFAPLHVRYGGQECALPLRRHDWAGRAAGEGSRLLVHFQRVGEGIIQSQVPLDLLCHRQEPPRDHGHLVAQLLERTAQALCAGCEDEVLLHLGEELIRVVALQQRHPGFQGLEEVEFASHGSLCDALHLITHARHSSQLVNDLLLN
mmetsp:Transcript_9540/g.22505  ORF Transcript_9540/g.22505 Transcript_9540/m.22505 type:complete len:242 (-) Transcript_9540:1261-1986(-)